MNNNAPNPYLRTKILTSSPAELRLLLFDGCLKFCRQAKAALEAEKKDFEAIYENLMRSQKIVLELSTSLNHTANPEICEKLSALYTYIYRLMVDANLDRDVSKLDEAIKLVSYERETWALLMEKSGETEGQPQGAVAPMPYSAGAAQTAMSSLSQSA